MLQLLFQSQSFSDIFKDYQGARLLLGIRPQRRNGNIQDKGAAGTPGGVQLINLASPSQTPAVGAKHLVQRMSATEIKLFAQRRSSSAARLGMAAEEADNRMEGLAMAEEGSVLHLPGVKTNKLTKKKFNVKYRRPRPNLQVVAVKK